MNLEKWINRYRTDCALKYNSEATKDNYTSGVKSFLIKFDKYSEPKEIPTQEIKEYLLTFKTINTRKHNLCAIKSFYQITVGMPNKIDKIPYPKSDKKLPIVLSVDEVQSMFKVCDNLKHKVILALLYSCGLRVSELINLKWTHIDRSRMIINIIQAKGNKDRQVMLTPELLPLLEKYWHEYKPKEYILNGQFPEKQLQYTDRSVGEVVKQIAAKAGINKRVYTHLMRHNCFTHMVENGTDINLIQKLAGHSSVKTTMIYTHISHNHISKIQSPLSNIRF
ncbi:XerD Site-specific recombinase XerD [uncultured Caudovirales phage]|uniref:Integrase n=1 Tax=uncultured Caudovirales phage TaxID=2100421 RepID=A0A6J5L0R8_9CAUD|nr:XerD Site-specific recombinase XerD [uncultured Caudovirales phage]